MHGDNQKDFNEFWHDPALTRDSCNATKPKWQQLLDEILRRGKYPPVENAK
jgi:hypothetical protein